MTKTHPEIAKAILERRNRMTHVILPGDINAAIGPDGVREALEQRWLVPDTDEGLGLCVTTDLGKLAEMRKLAEVKPEDWKPEPVTVPESHDMVMLHSRRAHPIYEVAAPMTGAASPALATIPQPQTAAANPTQAQMPLAIGTPVVVARQGQSAQGVIEKWNPDGRFTVGFPQGQKAPSGDNIYSKDELSLLPASPAGTGVMTPPSGLGEK